METQPKKHASDKDEAKNSNSRYRDDFTGSDDATEDDGTPVLDEADLEANNIDDEEADDIEWEDPNE